MSTLDLVGPHVPRDTHNMVLRDASLHVPTARSASSSNYVIVAVGIRDSEGTSWIGEWSQFGKDIAAGVPVSILDDGRHGMRLKERTSLVVRVTQVGAPSTLLGAEVDFRLGLVGGREGPAQGLVKGGAQVADPRTRAVLAAMERQINTGGLADWDESVQLHDPAHDDDFDAQDDYDTTDKDITTGGGTQAWDVSITFTKPSWATTGYVNVTVSGQQIGLTGGGAGTVHIYDGSSSLRVKDFTTATTGTFPVHTGYAGEITATTTFTPRGTATTNDHRVSTQHIYGTCSWK